MNYELHPARQWNSTELAAAITRGFEGYPIRMAPNAWDFEAMVVNDDIDLAASRIAIVGEEVAGIALLAVRGRRGWIGGLGVAPPFRRAGLARALMLAVMDNARHLGVQDLSLEVLQANEAALSLYRSLGFQTQDELLFWVRSLEAGPLPPPFQRPEAIAVEEALAHWNWHEVSPPWQRETESLRRRMARWGGSGRARGILSEEGLGAYALFAVTPNPGNGQNEARLLDLAVAPDGGLRGPGRALLQGLHNEFRETVFRIDNVPADDSINILLGAMNYQVTLRQWGMHIRL